MVLQLIFDLIYLLSVLLRTCRQKNNLYGRFLLLFFADASYLPSTWCTIKYVYPLMSWAYMGSVQTTIALTVERFLSLKRLGNR